MSIVVVADFFAEFGKFNSCHDSKGQFCATGGGGGGSASIKARRSRLSKDTREWAEEWDARNEEWGLGKLSGDLLVHGGVAVITGQVGFGPDPDAKLVQKSGKYNGVSPDVRVPMQDHGCHWNAAGLFREGKVDAIGTGFVLTGGASSAKWIPHSWGVRNGKIVETTEANFGAQGYYGVVLRGTLAKKFAASMYFNNPEMLNTARAAARKWNLR